MENMKSLADQLREELQKPEGKKGLLEKSVQGEKGGRKGTRKSDEPAIMTEILNYDTSLNKSMVHARFDDKTVRLMNQFKMATEVDVTKLVSFAVRKLFETHPELKTIIKQFIQNSEL